MTDDAGQTDQDKLKALIALFLLALMAPGDRFLSGEVLPERLPGLWLPIVADFHARAGVLGRTAAGVEGPEDAADEAFGQEATDFDAPYLQNFAKQLESTPATPDSLRNRLSLYADRLHASAHEAFVMASPPDSAYTWNLGAADVEHCSDCVAIADGSPYTADTLPTFPGSGETECGTRCRCWLERQDGIAPFKDD